jgi:L,D-transpeptidase ErfK/SrfK
MKKIILLITGLVLFSGVSVAATYDYRITDSVVGQVTRTQARFEQTLPDIARIHKLGFGELKRANQDVDSWIPGAGQEVVLPTQHILPVAPHEGIIINIPEMRLYYFPKAANGDTRQVITFPIGIGREGRSTPYIATTIIQKTENPTWYPPESIRAEHAAEGRPLPRVVPPGPENPLGDFAMRLGLPSYLIHGTNRPYGVGMRVSSGCIRMYPEDIEALFGMVGLGTRVRIVNQPYKVGILDGNIYLQANPFLEEDTEQFDGNLTSVVKMLVTLSGEQTYDVDWDLAKRVIDEQSGAPVRIGRMVPAALNQYTENREEDAMLGNTALELKIEDGLRF